MLIGILSGFISGIVASFGFWFFISHILKPKLEIDSKIYKSESVDDPKNFDYRVKVTNLSKRFSVYDVDFAARAYIYGLYPKNPERHKIYAINVGADKTPYIKSSVGENERFVILRPPYHEGRDGKGLLRRLYNKHHDENHQLNGSMSLEDVFHIIEEQKHTCKIVLYVTATSAFSTSRAIEEQVFFIDNIDSNMDISEESLFDNVVEE